MSHTLTRNYDGYGSGSLSPDNQWLYINISKNASSFMTDVLTRSGWTNARYGYDSCDYSRVKNIVVVLRDPVDRWCSGVAQYLVTRILNYLGPNTYQDGISHQVLENYPLPATSFIIAYNALIERFIFDNLDLLDDHVWCQHEFFDRILPDVPRTYIIMSETFEAQVKRLGVKIDPDVTYDYNSSLDNREKSILKDFFQKKLDARPDLMQKVKRTYVKDYEMIRNAPPVR